MSERAQIIVVGGGAIGLSVAYHLAHLGLEDVLLLERDQLTSGSSWHAAGIVGPLRASMNLTQLARYALELFVELETETGQATGYQQTGGVWLGQNTARMQELRRIKAMGDRSGLQTEILEPEAIRERLPWLQTDDLSGGLWVAQDGQVNPVDLCMAYARAARALGVEIREQSPVARIESVGASVSAVTLSDGERIDCDKLVLCTGAWTRQLAAQVGVDVPLAVCEHMYLVTDVIESLPRPCPIVRDLENAIYLKADSGKLVLGAFESNPKPWAPAADDAGFLMFDEDWQHAEPMLQAGIRRAPFIADHGITHFMNGPESFTPDTRQIMGEAPGCRNLFVAAGFNSIGIMSSAGVGRAMAPWIRDNHPPMDLWEVDIARLDPLQNQERYLAERLPEAVHNQFDMHWPYKQYRSGRDLRRSAWHDLLQQRGAVFGAPSGWERPLWYARQPGEQQMQYSYGAQSWWPTAAAEARHCQRHVSLFELSPFSKFDISGAAALSFLQRLCSNDVDVATGRIVYSLLLNPAAGIEAEVTVTRLAVDRFRMVGAAASRFKDLYWLNKQLDAESTVIIEDVTEQYAVAGIMGPKSRQFLREIGNSDFDDKDFAYACARTICIDGCELLAQRLSYVGELGWELFIPRQQARRVLSKILRLGEVFELGLAGHLALDACRLEVGFRHWGHDMGAEDKPREVGLGFAVKADKSTGFIGQQALQRQTDSARRLRLCEVTGDDLLVLHDEPVYSDGEIVGHCTSGGRGFRSDKTLAFVMFYDQASLTSRCQIELAGERHPLLILDKPPYQVVR